MSSVSELTTARLRLRRWCSDDLAPFAEMNADPDVMEYFPSPLSTEASNQLAHVIQTKIDDMGWGLWAVELTQTRQFIGFVGLNVPSVTLPCSPCTEIGWRLAKPFWKQGFATEAGRRVLAFAFNELALDEVVSFTAVQNTRSRAVMERLGLQNSNENFLHPMVAPESGLQDHVLYKTTAEQYRKRQLE